MIFLKKFYAYGFKSFADETTIDFKHEMTGIVGPNGSGKSNIVDAFRWVLGEQSMKDMRGGDKFDMIFKGSSTNPPSKYAQVTLTFDNSQRSLHYDKDEISITRKLYRDTGDTKYYINNEIARLKDIQLIFTDTGLSKGSLGIISQGTVNSFSESKPLARRKIFEDAAGLGKYSTQKEQSLRHLEKTEVILESIIAVEKELEKDIKKLSKQAEAAKIWKEKQNKLKDIELTILVKDVAYFSDRLKELELKLGTFDTDISSNNIKKDELKQTVDYNKQKIVEIDKDLAHFNEEILAISDKLTSYEKKLAVFNSQLQIELNSDDMQEKINAYHGVIISTKKDIEMFETNANNLQEQIRTYTEIVNNLSQKKEEKRDQLNMLTNKITEKQTRYQMIEEQIRRNSNLSQGVRTILDNPDGVRGVHGTVASFIEVPTKYEIAITKALGNSINNLIVDSSENAKNAIAFLKKNSGGVATFLPLKEIKEKHVRSEHLDVLTELEGFIGVASNLINIDPKMKPVIDALIGQVIIASNINDAVRISQLTFQLYKIITLDGDIVFPGGALTGGYSGKTISSFNLDKKRDEIKAELEKLNSESTNIKLTYEQINSEHLENEVRLGEKKYTLNDIQNKLEASKKNYENFVNEYENLTKKSIDDLKDIDEDTIQQQINKLNIQKTKIRENISICTKNKMNYTSKLNDLEGKLEDVRMQSDKFQKEYSEFKDDYNKCKNICGNAKTRINETYQMTLEHAITNYNKELPMTENQARDIIRQLRSEIDALGVINMASVEELEEKESKYEHVTNNRKDVEQSAINIRNSIIELDKEATQKFIGVIDGVNNVLPNIFKFLFGGGNCVVKATDPENILESGIEVIAHPPGKNISNLNLLSGGEKTLVAISVLFSILKISSFPIIILDEAEAALDIANVERFAKIIRENSKETQFLIITHRPGTMKECELLLGATMQTPGVTNLISVSTSHAIKLIEDDEK